MMRRFRRRFFATAEDAAQGGAGAKHFVLVHGAWHGAWCWYRATTLLQARGHRVTTLDLPAHGVDPTPPASVTLEAYAARVIAALDAADGPVILVGHSMGGVVVSAVAEARPEKLEKLVYLAAFLLPDGGTLLDAATGDADSLATPNLIVRPEEGVVDIDRDASAAIFYGHCRAEDVSLARALLRPNPLTPFATPLALSEARYGSVRRFYIECLEDRAITPAAQRSMVRATPCEAVYTLHTDHSPFFSRPRRLVRVLAAIARA